VTPPTARPTPGWILGVAGLVLAGAAYLTYRGSLAVPLVFDDVMGIERNATIHQLWPPVALLHPPFDTSVSGRPILNASFAVSYALGGGRVEAYHAGNLLIHVLAGLVLFGLVRRTLLRWSVLPRENDALVLAFAVALLWLVHPLQTESVTYVIQRAESLMGLFYLLTLYCFVRYVEGGRPAWAILAVLASSLGMGTKEVMISAPVIVLLYDRTFVAGSLGEAWRRRWRLYLCLVPAMIWVLLLAFGTKNRNGTAGFGIGVRWGDYLLTQFPALARYLRLAFWPTGQVFDYGAQWVTHAWAVLPAALLTAALLAATLWALVRRPAVGFLGVWFFVILAPTSLIPGNRQTIAEHRMYLALAPLLVLVGVTLYRMVAGGRAAPGRNRAILGVTLVLAGFLGAATARRNRVYLTNFGLWQDTVAKNPGNFFARNNLGNFFLSDGQTDAALAQYQAALLLKPDFPEAHNNLGTALAHAGRPKEAMAEYHAAIRLKAEYYPDAHNNLGVALARGGDQAGALREFQEVLKARPDFVETYFNEGNALGKLGRPSEALAAYQEALRRGMDIPPLHNNLGNVLAELGRTSEALAQYGAAVRLDPNYADGYNNLGTAFSKSHRIPEAIKEYQRAVWLRPRATDMRLNLANALAQEGRLAEAETQYREALQMQPGSVETLNNLGNVLVQDGQVDEAVTRYEQALRVEFDSPELHNNLGAAFQRQNRMEEARREFAISLQLKPGYDKARQNLDRLEALPRPAPRLHPAVPGL
jgi:protein O-mannosyl-transferase